MKAFLFSSLFIIAVAAYESSLREISNLRDLTVSVYKDANSFILGCSSQVWLSDQDCLKYKLTDYKCCAGTTSALGQTGNACYPQGPNIGLTDTTSTSTINIILRCSNKSYMNISILIIIASLMIILM